MKLSNNYILNFRSIIIIVCFVFCATGSAQAQTQDFDKIWTTVGSDGTVDEADTGKVFFDQSVVQMGSLPINQPNTKKKPVVFPKQTQSAVIRYNVTPVDGLFTHDDCGRQLTIRYLASGSGARVIAKLIEVDLATGAANTRLTLDSRDFAAVNGYQVQSSKTRDLKPFDFRLKAYYVEATLTGNRLAIISAAGIQMIKIDIGVCIN